MKNPAELVFVFFLLLDPPEYPAELAFVLFLLLNPSEFRRNENSGGTCFCFLFVAGSAGISGGTCFCFVFVVESVGISPQ
jgi:hypothetical protein